jgi:hypothetical protein
MPRGEADQGARSARALADPAMFDRRAVTTDSARGLSLQVTADATMLYTTECPHLSAEARHSLTSATPAQLESLPVCFTCRDTLDGERRRMFATLDAAMEVYQSSLENPPRMRRSLPD